MAVDWLLVGGFTCGALAGAAARFGRICTMGAIEDALVARDFRGARAWGVALAVAVALTEVARLVGAVDIARSGYVALQFNALASLLGGLLFGLGMTLVGTCSFGLVVRLGGGDLRALVSAGIVGIFAFATTAGLLAPARAALLHVGTVTLAPLPFAPLALPFGMRTIVATGLSILLLVVGLSDRRLWKRPRLLIGAVGIGLAVVLSWIVTTAAVAALHQDRVESLSFVAPVGRALLQFMMEPFRQLGFGVATVVGVVAGSGAVSIGRGEHRWEAFDDAREMRRHLIGAALMGFGGVLAQGCTIGQGLSAASTLAWSVPLFLAGVLLGAKAGLAHLIEGSLWPFSRGGQQA